MSKNSRVLAPEARKILRFRTVGCSGGQASAIQDPDMVVLPAPDPPQAVHFPPAISDATLPKPRQQLGERQRACRPA